MMMIISSFFPALTRVNEQYNHLLNDRSSIRDPVYKTNFHGQFLVPACTFKALGHALYGHALS